MLLALHSEMTANALPGDEHPHGEDKGRSSIGKSGYQPFSDGDTADEQKQYQQLGVELGVSAAGDGNSTDGTKSGVDDSIMKKPLPDDDKYQDPSLCGPGGLLSTPYLKLVLFLACIIQVRSVERGAYSSVAWT